MPRIERNLKKLLEYATEKEKELLLSKKKADDPQVIRAKSIIRQLIASRVRMANLLKKK